MAKATPPTPVRDDLHLHEHLRPQFAYLDDDIGRDVQALGCLADGLGIRSLVQAVGLFLVGAQEREQPLDADPFATPICRS